MNLSGRGTRCLIYTSQGSRPYDQDAASTEETLESLSHSYISTVRMLYGKTSSSLISALFKSLFLFQLFRVLQSGFVSHRVEP